MSDDLAWGATPTNEHQDVRKFDQAPYLAAALNWASTYLAAVSAAADALAAMTRQADTPAADDEGGQECLPHGPDRHAAGRCRVTPALPREERAALVAEAAALTEDPEFEASLHIGGMEQDLARFVIDRVPALLDALDAAEEENERLRVHLDDATRSRGDWAAAELAQRGRADAAEAALAALREAHLSQIDQAHDDLLLPPDLSHAESWNEALFAMAERLRALAAAPRETEEGR